MPKNRPKKGNPGKSNIRHYETGVMKAESVIRSQCLPDPCTDIVYYEALVMEGRRMTRLCYEPAEMFPGMTPDDGYLNAFVEGWPNTWPSTGPCINGGQSVYVFIDDDANVIGCVHYNCAMEWARGKESVTAHELIAAVAIEH
jgi:hypothetical protein